MRSSRSPTWDRYSWGAAEQQLAVNEKRVPRPPGPLEETGQPVVPLFLNRKLWAAGNLAVPQEAGPHDERDELGAVTESLSLTGHGAA